MRWGVAGFAATVGFAKIHFEMGGEEEQNRGKRAGRESEASALGHKHKNP